MATAKTELRVMDLLREDAHSAREKWGEIEGTELQKQIIRDAIDNPEATAEELSEKRGEYTPQWVVKTLARTDRDMWRQFLDYDGPDAEPTDVAQADVVDAEGDSFVGVFVMSRADPDDLSDQLSDVLEQLR